MYKPEKIGAIPIMATDTKTVEMSLSEEKAAVASKKKGAAKIGPMFEIMDADKLALCDDMNLPDYDPNTALPVMEHLKASLRANGWDIGRPAKAKWDEKSGKWRITNGGKTFKACLEVNAERAASGKGDEIKVPVVKQMGDDLALWTSRTLLNSGATEDSPLVKAQRVAKLLELNNGNIPAVAAIMQCGVISVRNYNSLNNLNPVMRRAFQDGLMDQSTAYVIAKLSAVDQEPEFKRLQAIAKAAAKKNGAPVDGSAPSDGAMPGDEAPVPVTSAVSVPKKKGKAESNPRPPAARPPVTLKDLLFFLSSSKNTLGSSKSGKRSISERELHYRELLEWVKTGNMDEELEEISKAIDFDYTDED